jgi:hypothetical protein
MTTLAFAPRGSCSGKQLFAQIDAEHARAGLSDLRGQNAMTAAEIENVLALPWSEHG